MAMGGLLRKNVRVKCTPTEDGRLHCVVYDKKTGDDIAEFTLVGDDREVLLEEFEADDPKDIERFLRWARRNLRIKATE